jgi:non-ribosomal peptide synthetase component F
VQQQLWDDLEHLHYDPLLLLREIRKCRGGDFLVNIQSPGLDNLASLEASSCDESLYDERYSSGQLAHILIDAFFTDGEIAYAIANIVDTQMANQMLDLQHALLSRIVADVTMMTTTVVVPVPQPNRQEEVIQPWPADWLFEPLVVGLPSTLHHAAVVSDASSDLHSTVSSSTTLSYAQVVEHAVRIAWQLMLMLGGGRTAWNHWDGPCMLVGIVMVKGWQQVVSAIGTLMAGCAYLPLSAEYPMERIRRVLCIGAVEVVLTQPQYVQSLDWPSDVQVLSIHSNFTPSSPLPADWSEMVTALMPKRKPTASDLAYVIFTSGSTGS